MGLVNQGWFVRCDNCLQADSGSIAGRSRTRAVRDALDAGWFQKHVKVSAEKYAKRRWFCGDPCLGEFTQARGSRYRSMGR